MISLFRIKEYLASVRQLLLWTLLVLPVGLLSGSASAFFLWSLEKVTHLRWEHGWLLFLLPLAGVAIVWIYNRFGKTAEGGNNLVLDRIHEPGGGVPARMAPLVLLTTLMSHLFGGSVGREGTAIQMGGSLASLYARVCRIGGEHSRMILMAGVAAGFGSVFGTPLTGAIFAMEVLVIGKVQYDALIPVMVASLVGDMTCAAWGVHHTLYHISFTETASQHSAVDLLMLAKVAVAAVAFGITGRLFAELTYNLQTGLKKITSNAQLRAAIGGCIVIALVYIVGTRDYIGLGVHSQNPDGVSLISSFHEGGAGTWSWALKLIFTAITLAAGFKGGEVTPLFFIGAALGNTLAWVFHAPVDLFAGIGFIAVFAGATNTPLACTVMGVELFGAHFALYFAVACFIAYYCSGHSGIYSSQRLAMTKSGRELPEDLSIKEVRELDRLKDENSLLDAVDRVHDFLKPSIMKESSPEHHIVTSETGKIRIYMTPSEKMPASGLWGKLNAQPVYREIVKAAKTEGLNSAAAFMTHYGFSNGGTIQEPGAETPNPSLTLCVELIDTKTKLEAFCVKHGELLKGKVIVYKHLEHWDVCEGSVDGRDASPNELVDGLNAKVGKKD